jgi:hypothetical protein
MVRSVTERYLVAAFAFMAAATWLGVALIHGFICLLVALLASQAWRLYQRRADVRARTATRRRRPSPQRPVEHRLPRPEPYDGRAESPKMGRQGDVAWE